MIFKTMQIVAVVVAILSPAILTAEASAQCCGAATAAYYQPAAYSAYYQPTAYTAYSPVAYQTYRTGWYPGYFLDRIRARLWGSPSTYVAAYPSTYAASYPSAYVASYPSSYVASYPSSYVASYPSYSVGYASSYSPCCGTAQHVTMQPACCSTCGVSGVSQASYESGGCSSCGVGASSGSTIVVPSETVTTPGTQYGTNSNDAREPELAPGEQVAPERTFRRPANGGSQQDIQPEPGNDTNEGEIEKVLEGEGAESSTYFEPPKLFDLNDRTARRTIGPVRTAIYHGSVTHRPV
ncbi:MAG TPA: hypothetical protein VHK01_18965, partial [Lacipirellulaceae bacterium]|nr:hypothetical protein [Lacipirellulaceae bacterium]